MQWESYSFHINILNEENEGWETLNWWEGKTTNCGNHICCTKCVNDEKVPPEPVGIVGNEIVSNQGGERVPLQPTGKTASTQGDEIVPPPPV